MKSARSRSGTHEIPRDATPCPCSSGFLQTACVQDTQVVWLLLLSGALFRVLLCLYLPPVLPECPFTASSFPDYSNQCGLCCRPSASLCAYLSLWLSGPCWGLSYWCLPSTLPAREDQCPMGRGRLTFLQEGGVLMLLGGRRWQGGAQRKWRQRSRHTNSLGREGGSKGIADRETQFTALLISLFNKGPSKAGLGIWLSCLGAMGCALSGHMAGQF